MIRSFFICIFMKQFDVWNVLKQDIDCKDKKIFFYEREVWWCSVGINIGVEINGKNVNFERPVLIVRKFNKHMFWGISLTSKEKTGPFFYKISHDHGISWAALTQMRVFSTKRMLRKIGMISASDFREIKAGLEALIKSSPQ